MGDPRVPRDDDADDRHDPEERQPGDGREADRDKHPDDHAVGHGGT